MKIATIISICGLIFAIILLITVPNWSGDSPRTKELKQNIVEQEKLLDVSQSGFLDLCNKTQNLPDLDGCYEELRKFQKDCKEDLKNLSSCNDERLKTFFENFESRRNKLSP